MMAAAATAAFLCVSPGALDGDTLRCREGFDVRLWGINTPERYEPAGPAAGRALGTMVAGQTVRCTVRGPKSYGRLVAQCFVGRHDLGEQMIRQGWAVDVPRYSGGYYRRFAW